MDYRDFNNVDGLFLFMTVFNTMLGLENYQKNEKQNDRQNRIEGKLDRVLEILGDKNELE